MPIRRTPLTTGQYYHVYNRGVEKRPLFLYSKDYHNFLNILRWYLREDLERPGLSKYKLPKISLKHCLTVVAYCLMPNHFHLLVKQEQNKGISEFMRVIGVTYAMYFNHNYDRVGSLFQGRFQAKLVTTDEYLLQVSKYIHRNPLEIIAPQDSLTNYSFSSYPVYLQKYQDKLTEPQVILSYFSQKNPQADYQQFVEESAVDEEGLQAVLFQE